MEDTIVTADPSASESGDSVETQDSAGTQTRRTDPLIPIPASKWRSAQQAQRDLEKYREEERTRNLSTASTTTLNKEQEDALDLIANRTAGKFSKDLASVRDELDGMALEREYNRIDADPRADVYREEFQTSLTDLMRKKPFAKMGELAEEARKDAIYKAYESGKLTQDIAEETEEQTRTKSRLSSPSRNANATGRGKTEKSLDQMTPQEIADSGRFDEFFAATQGRRPRR